MSQVILGHVCTASDL